ncbi:hypothetical protein N566_18660, partial [Streptomycetaceae bacterium MP113-05]
DPAAAAFAEVCFAATLRTPVFLAVFFRTVDFVAGAFLAVAFRGAGFGAGRFSGAAFAPVAFSAVDFFAGAFAGAVFLTVAVFLGTAFFAVLFFAVLFLAAVLQADVLPVTGFSAALPCPAAARSGAAAFRPAVSGAGVVPDTASSLAARRDVVFRVAVFFCAAGFVDTRFAAGFLAEADFAALFLATMAAVPSHM